MKLEKARIIDVIDHYETRKNDPGLYPRDKQQEKTVIVVKKIISWNSLNSDSLAILILN